MPEITILHITSHLGGGVGRVVLNYLAEVKGGRRFMHQVACLDYANENAVAAAKNTGFELSDRMAEKPQQLLGMIAKADIILIHFWNHPLLYDFLVRYRLPESRVVMWSHTSGFHPPYVFTDKILRYPDLFVFASPVSYETREVKNLSEKEREFLRVVWSTGGVGHVRSLKPKAHAGFNVGYVGTVDYCKIHPDFFSICSKINIPEANFIVCGGPKENEFRQEAERLGLSEKFNFTGLVPDVTEYLPLFDVFGYPLAPYHYGTCDQALAESMASGIVPVVLPNRMESFMVKNGITGIVAKDPEEYADAIEGLYADGGLRSKLSANAREYASENFSIEVMKRGWEKVFEEALTFRKTEKNWEINAGGPEISAKDVFLESIGDYGKDFVSYCNAKSSSEMNECADKIKKLAEVPLWQAETRGTVHHYHSVFGNDAYLSGWSKMMKAAACSDGGNI